MEYNGLIANVTSVIKENGNEEITGQVLQDVLVAIIESLGTGYQLMGLYTGSVDDLMRTEPDQKVAYFFYTASPAAGDLFDMEAGLHLIYFDSDWAYSKLCPAHPNDDEIVEIPNTIVETSEAKARRLYDCSRVILGGVDILPRESVVGLASNGAFDGITYAITQYITNLTGVAPSYTIINSAFAKCGVLLDAVIDSLTMVLVVRAIVNDVSRYFLIRYDI